MINKNVVIYIYTCAKTAYGVYETLENLINKVLEKACSAEKNDGVYQISESDGDDN